MPSGTSIEHHIALDQAILSASPLFFASVGTLTSLGGVNMGEPQASDVESWTYELLSDSRGVQGPYWAAENGCEREHTGFLVSSPNGARNPRLSVASKILWTMLNHPVLASGCRLLPR